LALQVLQQQAAARARGCRWLRWFQRPCTRRERRPASPTDDPPCRCKGSRRGRWGRQGTRPRPPSCCAGSLGSRGGCCRGPCRRRRDHQRWCPTGGSRGPVRVYVFLGWFGKRATRVALDHSPSSLHTPSPCWQCHAQWAVVFPDPLFHNRSSRNRERGR